MSFEQELEKVFGREAMRKEIKKNISKLSDESLYDESMKLLKPEWEKNGGYTTNWHKIITNIINLVGAKSKKDKELLDEILATEVYMGLKK